MGNIGKLSCYVFCVAYLCVLFSYRQPAAEAATWGTETVDSSGMVGTYTSIALDSSDDAHISYYDSTNGNLKYATNASGSWEAETVDSSGIVGKYTSIALDSSGNPHISYYDDTNDNLRYGSVVTTSGGDGDSSDSEIWFSCFIVNGLVQLLLKGRLMKTLGRTSVLVLVVLFGRASFSAAGEKDVLKALEKIKANVEADVPYDKLS